MGKQTVNSAFLVLVPLLVAAVLNAFLSSNHVPVVVPQHLDLTWEHKYFRPSGDDVSGVKGNPAKNHRSPCPALNALANHGYLPRDGKNVTPHVLQDALVEVYNLDQSLAEFLVSTLADKFSLADLGEHNVVEHDASLVHDDACIGTDPSSVNMTLASSLLARGNKDQCITRMTLAAYRREREAESAANTPDFEETFTAQRALTSYSESAVMLLVMGDEATTSISVDHARSFLIQERIPDDYEKPKVPVTLFRSLWITLQLKVLALLSPILG
ncbi:chloroperoxidase [Phytophthora sojae]|uniref:Chloroperoxidase n=1 Tax=Phytophthora sojae (strain P6497) TaxID=1094619 RepID=G5A444_PHYSP|nr:chloroperoxidase [Phytophthora sojae]EGZ09490.1 chloroperoxidase [Phytophthora sojae]|eukprot:XP_009534351.1 chloroperoxidase [Phytophthora sojae]